MRAHCREYSAAGRGTPGAALNFGVPLADDLVPRRGDGVTLAERAAAGGIQALPFFKSKTASFALSRLHAESLGMGGSGNVLQVVEDFLFAETE